MALRPDIALPPWPRPAPLEIDFSKAITLARQAFEKADALAAGKHYQQALIWAERAHRVAPGDPNIQFGLAGARLRAGQAAAAAEMFAALSARFDLPELWLGLAQARHECGDSAGAAASLARLLSRNLISPGFTAIAAHLAHRAGFAGFCGADGDLCLLADLPLASLTVTQGHKTLRPRHRRIGPIDIKAGPISVVARPSGAHLLGSPLDPAAMLRIEGIASRHGKFIEGWAWHPGAALRDPVLDLWDQDGNHLQTLTAQTLIAHSTAASPLLRAREFKLALSAPEIFITGPSGQALLGSPLPARIAKLAPRGHPHPQMPDKFCIVIPAYAGFIETQACIESVLLTKPAYADLIVVDDAIPDPALRAYVRDLAARQKIRLIPSDPLHGRNLGFVRAANAGLAAAGGADVVLLNADTIVPPNALAALREAAYGAPNIGTVTPLSNDATILSYPRPSFDRPFDKNPIPSAEQIADLNRLAAEANPGLYVELPTAHGFCMLIRADCLAAAGPLRADLFAQGYGEENDFCERAGAAGFIHIGLPSVFVGHAGNVSFGAARTHLLERNLQIIDKLYPAYRQRVEDFIAADPLHPARARLDRARFIAGRNPNGSVVLITHAGGGGTTRLIKERIAAIEALGLRAIILRPREGFCTVSDGKTEFYDLGAPLPHRHRELVALLGAENPRWTEIHHTLDHHPDILTLARDLAVPYDVIVHDWSFICERMSFIDGNGHYCGEPDSKTCGDCVARFGASITETISPQALRARSAALFAAARQVIVPHQDGAQRLARHFPGIAARVTHWEPHRALPAPQKTTGFKKPIAAVSPAQPVRIALIGGIGIEKGFDILLACAQDAARRQLALHFLVAGYTLDDAALMATGHSFVTGEFAPGEAGALIRGFAADLAFLPSIWPETWCYALTELWDAGLTPVVFDIGAQAARVRAAGRGHVLPLALPAAQINDFLIQEGENSRKSG